MAFFRARPKEQEKKEKPSEAEQEIRSLINDAHLLSQEGWAVSILRKFNTEHAFLVLEGIKQDGQPAIFRADFFQQLTAKEPIWRNIESTIKSSSGKAFIRLDIMTPSELNDLIGQLQFHSWGLCAKDAVKLMKKLGEESGKEYSYHIGGNNSSFSVSTSTSKHQNCLSWCLVILRDTLNLDDLDDLDDKKFSGFWATIIQKPSAYIQQIEEKAKKTQQQTGPT